VLNVHWTTPVLRSVHDPGRARAKVDAVVKALDDFTTSSGRLVWTVHNVLPHEAEHLEQETRLAQALADRSDVVHVLSMSTLTAAAPQYRLDASRTVCIPHSSYLGVYRDWVSRAGARRRLGLGDDDRVLLAFGNIRPYKGLDRLLDYVDRTDDDHLRLLVAGTLSGQQGSRELRARLLSSARTTSATNRVPDDLVQVWMRAADLAVLPYLRVLNSGAFLLAESFGLPVVAPREGSLTERDGEPHVRLFGEDDFEQVLGRAVADLVADPEGNRRARESAHRAAAARPVSAMAARFADLVEPLLSFTQP
jgi:glycosyltransferase involved in cell wall biosynthesis